MGQERRSQNMGGSSSERKEFAKALLRRMGVSSGDIHCQALKGDGSKRRFWRIHSPGAGNTFIAMENTPDDDLSRRENLAYLRIGTHLHAKGLPLPEIYDVDLERGWFLMEDLGDRSLQDRAAGEEDRLPIYRKTAEILFRMQIHGSEGFDTAWTCQTESYDYTVMRRFEADYFRDSFLLGYLKIGHDLSNLEGSFDCIARSASRAGGGFFLHRDFQSRNIMVFNERIGIIDWQGGRLGPLGYDLASLLIDPYARLGDEEKNDVYRHYVALLKRHEPGWTEPFERDFPYLALQRNLQILGAFSFLSRVRGKTYFEVYIPPALKSLAALLRRLEEPELTPLRDLVESLLQRERTMG